MQLALRGVVDKDGDIVAWPMLAMDHDEMFAVLPHLKEYRARWRQWEPGKNVDFDPGASEVDKIAVRAYVKVVQNVSR